MAKSNDNFRKAKGLKNSLWFFLPGALKKMQKDHKNNLSLFSKEVLIPKIYPRLMLIMPLYLVIFIFPLLLLKKIGDIMDP